MVPPARGPRLFPLMLATMASQALLVVLSPTIAAIAGEFGVSVGAVGQARSITAVVAIAASLSLATKTDVIGVRRLLAVGAALAIAACGVVAVAPGLPVFLGAHVLVGLGFACLLSAGFAGVAAFDAHRRGWAIGYVAGANALAWIVVNPVVGTLTDSVSWRVSQAVPALLALGALLAARSAAAVPGAHVAPRLRALVGESSARRWIGAESLAYAAWTALITYVGAYFIERHGAGETAVGWWLAAGAAAYFVASAESGRLTARVPRRLLVAGAALVMAGLLPLELNTSGPLSLAGGIFCLAGLMAGIRTPASSGLGLEQLPASPGAMMTARTAATQLGYLLGAVIGGALIAGPGYGTFGFVLALTMIVSAALMLRVDDPADRRGIRVGAPSA
jgi:predicted MFS family arabinose efflux permease